MFGLKKGKASNRKPDIIIAGLGNPGAQYDGTRHNVGFAVIDRIAQMHKVKLATFKNQARFVTLELDGKAVLLVKPMTYMNLSGRAIAHLAKQYAVPPERILVVADDLDTETGKTKMKPKGGSGGHNGHKSIAQSLGTEDYPRIRIGIGKSGETVDHVLSRFAPQERGAIDDAIDRAVETCIVFIEQGLNAAMKFCNTD